MDSQKILQILEIQILGNTLGRYLFAGAIFVISVLVLKTIERVFIRRLKKDAQSSTYSLQNFVIDITQQRLVPIFYFVAFYVAITQLALTPELTRFVHGVTVVILTFQVTKLSLAILIFAIEEFWLKKQPNYENAVAFKSILSILRIGLWGMAVVFVLDNLGFNVAAVVAGLGIGGIAVALAAQTILGDLFNYFVIFFDKPFVIGDAITVGSETGTVEHIGIKTTRIKSTSGEQIVMANSQLTSAPLRNHKRMAERAVVFKIGVLYQTPAEKLKRIPDIIKQIVQAIPKTRFDRSHFQSFGEFSLIFETVYFVQGADYGLYMDIHQKVNLAIKEAFEREQIDFAYPTQTIYSHSLNPQP